MRMASMRESRDSDRFLVNTHTQEQSHHRRRNRSGWSGHGRTFLAKVETYFVWSRSQTELL